jgi:hypothetical protein
MSSEEDTFNSESMRSEFIFARNGAAVFLCVYFIINWLDFGKTGLLFQVFALLGIVGAVAKAYWVGTTILSIRFQSKQRWWFQIAISILTPLLLLLILLRDATSLNLDAAFASHLNWSFLLVIAFIAFASWHGAKELSKRHAFRGFVISSAIFFVILYLGIKGFSFGADEYGYEDSLSKEEQTAVVNSGSYAAQYILYIVTSYISMLTKMAKDNHPFFTQYIRQR